MRFFFLNLVRDQNKFSKLQNNSKSRNKKKYAVKKYSAKKNWGLILRWLKHVNTVLQLVPSYLYMDEVFQKIFIKPVSQKMGNIYHYMGSVVENIFSLTPKNTMM